MLDTLQDMGYISYTLEDTKQLIYYKAVIVFRHVYDVKRLIWERCVPADAQIDVVIRLIFKHMLNEAFPIEFRHYDCCAVGEEECTEVYVIPISEFETWLSQEISLMEILPKAISFMNLLQMPVEHGNCAQETLKTHIKKSSRK